jgi:ApbE superfamily uncharacterized protein (UPF0280 family)
MSAVAGLVAEMTADFLAEAGAKKALVENGGDLAVYLTQGQKASVGVKLKITDSNPLLKLVLSSDSRSRWGVCSSGFGGRSLTLGVADTAMCVAESAAIADAAATAVANATVVDSPSIKRLPAELLRPETDIPGLMATSRVGQLTREERDMALAGGMQLAQSLVDRGLILGALVSLDGRFEITDGFEAQVASLSRL